MKKSNNDKLIAFRINSEVYNKLCEVAKNNNVNVSEAIRIIITKHLNGG